MNNTPNPQERNPLAIHEDPSLRRDRSLRRRSTRATRTDAAGIEWVMPTELAMRTAAGLTAAGMRANVRVVTAARRRAARAARGTADRVARLAPVSAFGAARRSRARRGPSL